MAVPALLPLMLTGTAVQTGVLPSEKVTVPPSGAGVTVAV
jgi:hypothetical protein